MSSDSLTTIRCGSWVERDWWERTGEGDFNDSDKPRRVTRRVLDQCRVCGNERMCWRGICRHCRHAEIVQEEQARQEARLKLEMAIQMRVERLRDQLAKEKHEDQRA